MEQFDCEAYGPNSGLLSDACFMGGDDILYFCQTSHQCAVRLKAERQRVWQVIQRLAATDSTWEGISRDIRHPEQLLGGRLSATPSSTSSEDDL